MASLKIRYGGNVATIQEGFNYNASYGTKKLNLKVNTTSTMRLGLTTNTNAKDYCKFKVKVGGQIAYIGRVSSTSYLSGDTVDYHGSTMTSRSQAVSTSSDVSQSSATLPYPIATSSMQTVTGYVTQSYTNNAGSGNGTANANPTIRTVTNATGSSVTTRTASAEILTSQKTSWTYYYWERSTTISYYTYGDATNAKITRSFSRRHSRSVKHQYLTVASTYETISRAGQEKTLGEATKSWKTSFKWTSRVEGDWSTGLSSASGTTRANNATTGQSSGSYWNTQTRRYSQTTSLKNMTSTTSYYVTQYDWGNYKNGATITYRSYSTRWSYWWTSCSKYTNTTYYTSVTRSTTSVSETLHNMNI